MVRCSVLFHRLDDLQGAFPNAVPQVLEPLGNNEVAAAVHVGRGEAELIIGAPDHPLQPLHHHAGPFVHLGVGEAAGDGGGGALHHAEGVRVLHVPVRVRPQRPWRKQTVGVTTGSPVLREGLT